MQNVISSLDNIPMNRVLVAIDNGFDSTKVYCIIKGKEFKFKFHSKYEQVLVDDDLNKNNTFKLYWNDSVYLIGEGASNNSFDDDKYNNDLHKICTYTALSKLSNFIGYEFDLVVGYPLSTCSVSKDMFSNYLKCTDIIETELGGELRRFKVNNVIVIPQGISAVYSQDLNSFKNKVIGILDIGGKTVNGIILNNLNPVRSTMFTEDLGILILYNKIKLKLVSEGYNVADYQIPYIIRDGLIGCNTDEIRGVIEGVINEHMSEIKLTMRKNKWAIESIPILCIGGGGIVLKDYLCKILPHGYIVEDSDYVNVKGYYEVGRVYYGY